MVDVARAIGRGDVLMEFGKYVGDEGLLWLIILLNDE